MRHGRRPWHAGRSGRAVPQPAQRSWEVALEVFDQLRPVIGQLTQLAAFVASGPDALGDVLRRLALLIGLCAVALDKAAQACGVQKRDLGVARCACGAG